MRKCGPLRPRKKRSIRLSRRVERPTSTPRLRTGRIQKSQKGITFVIPDDNSLKDTFVTPDQAKQLLNHDRVEYREKYERGRRVALIEKVLGRSQKYLVGTVTKMGNNWLVRSLENEYHNLVSPPPQNVKERDWIIGRFEKYPNSFHGGLISPVEILGKELLPIHDEKIVIHRFQLESTFPSEALREAEFLEENSLINENSLPLERRDLRSIPFVTIDGEDAKDFDDAVAVLKQHQHSPFVLFVSIADVSHYVQTGSALDRSARKRGTSVYFPGKCLPMLPEALSNNLCSLLPKTNRFCITAEIHFDRFGNITKNFFYPSLIKTAARLTYTEVQRFFDQESETKSTLSHLSEPLKNLRQLFRLLEKKRTERGVLDFDLPECKIQIDPQGNVIDCRRAPSYESNRLIEEFMIAANSAVAQACREAKFPCLYRTHGKPDPKGLDEINSWLKNFGINARIENLTPKAISRILKITQDTKGGPALHYAVLRLQKQARYEAEPKGHFGLALSDYTHFTSPIRRYPDLLVHRALKQLITQAKRSDKKYEDKALFDVLGHETSDSERKAMEAERFMNKRKQCWFMKKHLGQNFPGRISGVLAKGLFVEIVEYAIEGFVPEQNLPGNFHFDRDRNCFRSYSQKKDLSVGDPLAIQVASVSLENNEINFVPVEP